MNKKIKYRNFLTTTELLNHRQSSVKIVQEKLFEQSVASIPPFSPNFFLVCAHERVGIYAIFRFKSFRIHLLGIPKLLNGYFFREFLDPNCFSNAIAAPIINPKTISGHTKDYSDSANPHYARKKATKLWGWIKSRVIER